MTRTAVGTHPPSRRRKLLLHKPTASQKTVICWNCNGNHVLQECDKPHNQKRIAAARQKFLKKKRELQAQRKRGNGPSGQRPNGSGRALKAERKTKVGTDGTPLVLNVKGNWVPDQKTIQAKKKESDKAALTALISDLASQSGSGTGSAESAPAPAPAPVPTAAEEQMSRIRSAVDSMFG